MKLMWEPVLHFKIDFYLRNAYNHNKLTDLNQINIIITGHTHTHILSLCHHKEN